MSCKCFLFVLIITQVKVAHPSKDQNASIDGCVSFNWIGDFFARHKQSEWNDTVNEIIEDCLSNYSKVNETTGCNGPIVNVTFPLFSCSSNATLLEREFSSVLVIKEESFTTGRQIVHAFAQIWKLLVLCIIAAMLSGIVIWFLDHRANSGHFPDSFWRGVQDGLWWAVVTMTTVGYGDKAPKSSLARMYASLWMIIGMLLMSTITAQISSSITADGLRPLNDVFGSKYSHGKYRYDMKQGYSKDGVEPFHFILLAFADVDIEKGAFNPKLRASVTCAVHMKELSTPSVNYYLEKYAPDNTTH
ncbi:hypothetical protein pdam_00001218 [Pocillopora damicornis]|uniref:Potassium channel domain-containing protein n=1 Tax=Pocillopora damicornis TaxID=46731 RepID=A0A3M6TL97_POCDA|nr:uncharacterized protein LOC113676210 [Pocillopora damicornis]RMX42014.1 hypothetical protein pdam_00001218 [Pocillopora damicornis]